MNSKLDKKQIERFSRQIILKNVGALGQKKIIQSNVLIIGMGGLGCPAAEFLTRAGVGSIGLIDSDKVELSNIHRQSLYDISDIKKPKVMASKRKLKKIIKNYDYIIDGSDNFRTKFLINDFCKIYNKFLVSAAISKFDGHIFTFDFKNKNTPCIRSFFQEERISNDILNCEYEGILGTVAGIIGTIQANEILKKILNIGKNLNGYILIIDLLNLSFRKVRLSKIKNA